MLRELPPLGPRDDEFFLNASGDHDNNVPHTTSHEPQTTDPLDDVFGSAPSSPTLAAREDGHGPNTEPSDVRRLRSIHVTNGYREGIAVSKEQHIQAGFDEGFSLGGEIGMKVGWSLGALEGIAKAIAGREREDAGKARELWHEAQEDMKMEKMLGEEYFEPDGIWKYEVPGQDDEGEGSVTFAEVAGHHPVVRKWREVVDGLLGKYGVGVEMDG